MKAGVRARRVLMAAAVLVFGGILWMLAGGKGRKSAGAVQTSVFAMDTFFTITAYGADEELAVQVEDRIRRLESLFSVTDPGSDISRINSGAEGGESGVLVSPETAELVGEALELCESTEGALDITIYPVLLAWGFTAGENRIPQPEELEERLRLVDYRRVQRGKDTGILVPAGAMLDLGAVAKGYTGDSILRLLRENGVKSAIVNLGGNVQTLGRKPDGSLWQVAIVNPFCGETPGGEASDATAHSVLCRISVGEKCVITSGSYQRYFVGEDGTVYGHILDPATGRPADSGLASVTVVGDSGVRCDGLSTALYVMGEEKACAYWRTHRDFEMILVTQKGEILVTEGLWEDFYNESSLEAREVRVE